VDSTTWERTAQPGSGQHNLGVDITNWEWTAQPGSGQHNLGVDSTTWERTAQPGSGQRPQPGSGQHNLGVDNTLEMLVTSLIMLTLLVIERMLKHAGGCTTKASGGCGICKRLWALVVEHVLLREGKGSDHANVIDGKEGWDCHDTVLGCGSYCHRDGGSAVCSQFLRLDLNREQPFITQSI
jgi:hypothetical protein